MVDGPKYPDIPRYNTNNGETNGGHVQPGTSYTGAPAGKGYETNSIALPGLVPGNIEYESTADAFHQASDGIAKAVTENYNKISQAIGFVISAGESTFTDGDQWEGETYGAMKQNFASAMQDLAILQTVASAMATVTDSFDKAIGTTKSQLLSNSESAGDKSTVVDAYASGRGGRYRKSHFSSGQIPNDQIQVSGEGNLHDRFKIGLWRIRYNTELSEGEKDKAEEDYRKEWNDFAKQVITGTYKPGMSSYASKNIPKTPELTVHTPKLTGPGGTGPGGTGPGGTSPGGTSPGGAKPGTPTVPNLKLPTPPTSTPTPGDPSNQNAPQAAQQAAQQAAGAASDAAKSAADAGKDALSKSLEAAQQAANSALENLGKNMPSMPEGVLSGLTSPTAARTGGAAGVGGGAKPPSLGSAERSSSAVNAGKSSTVAASAAPSASKAGISSQAGGAAGGGAPAAGAGRGAGSDKEHKTSKALRRAQNGTEILGETEAVVPVLGGTAEKPEQKPTPAKRT